MENLVSIDHTKKNTIEFDLTTEGVETKGMDVSLVVKSKGMDVRFSGKHKEGDTWEIKLPVLNHLFEKTAYNCQIEVVADGYHFVPMKGTLNVSGSAEVYTTAPKNKTLESDKVKKEEKKKVKETVIPTPGSYSSNPMSKSVQQLAEEAMAAQKNEAKKDRLIEAAAELVNENKAPRDEKAEKLAAILEEAGIKTTKKRDVRFSIKTKKLDS